MLATNKCLKLNENITVFKLLEDYIHPLLILGYILALSKTKISLHFLIALIVCVGKTYIELPLELITRNGLFPPVLWVGNDSSIFINLKLGTHINKCLRPK